MKNFIKIICMAFVIVSCNTNPTIQNYFVDNKDNNQFISLDISPNILKLSAKTTKNTKELEDILNSIKKVNVLILKEGQNIYQAENKKVKDILKNNIYKQLFKAKHKSGNISVQYTGKEDAINEIIVFASGKNEKSFALFRLLGDHIDPEKIMTLLNNTKIDKNSEDVNQIIDFIKNLF